MILKPRDRQNHRRQLNRTQSLTPEGCSGLNKTVQRYCEWYIQHTGLTRTHDEGLTGEERPWKESSRCRNLK